MEGRKGREEVSGSKQAKTMDVARPQAAIAMGCVCLWWMDACMKTWSGDRSGVIPWSRSICSGGCLFTAPQSRHDGRPAEGAKGRAGDARGRRAVMQLMEKYCSYRLAWVTNSQAKPIHGPIKCSAVPMMSSSKQPSWDRSIYRAGRRKLKRQHIYAGEISPGSPDPSHADRSKPGRRDQCS